LDEKQFRPQQQGPQNDADAGRKLWQEPKLQFVEPKLTPHGDFARVTGEFFGAFSPGE
jgi:hypothetical protein